MRVQFLGSTCWGAAQLAAAAALSVLAAGGAWAGEAAVPAVGLLERETLTGDWGGACTALGEHGIAVGFTYIGEVLGNFSGGIHQGWIYEGRLEGAVDLDLSKLVSWPGATIHASAYQIHHAHGMPAADYTGSIGDPSNIEARETIRFFTLWLEQSLFDDKLSVRVGQLAADDEFMTSDTAGGLINGTFGWGANLSANQVQGGPAYPLASPGVRLQVKPAKDLAVLGAMFFGDPAGHDCAGDPQDCNKHGTRFSFSGEPLWLAELHYAPNSEEGASGFPGVYKIGGWYGETRGDFIDQRRGIDALGAIVSQADPLVVSPLSHEGNWGIYGVADQMVWRDGERSANLFLRAGYSPSDRNLVTFYIDGGFGITGLISGRPADTLTFGAAYIEISGDARRLDEELLAVAGITGPKREAETVLEVSYTMPLAPWLSLQPDIQYIIHPGGNVPDTDDPSRAVGDAFVGGMRFTLAF